MSYKTSVGIEYYRQQRRNICFVALWNVVLITIYDALEIATNIQWLTQ